MFGSKLRSWMEAVRPRKKQHRNKEKQQKSLANASVAFTSSCSGKKVTGETLSDENPMVSDMSQTQKNVDSKSMQTIASQGPRYSGANLSSPESAYSTGYSTDGTSPGGPPDYYTNIRTDSNVQRPLPVSHAQPLAARINLSHEEDRAASIFGTSSNAILVVPDCENNAKTPVRAQPTNFPLATRLPEVALVQNASLLSPRQRNRIRTNPWVPGNNLSPGNSSIGLHIRQDLTPRASVRNSPLPTHYLNSSVTPSSATINRTVARCDSLSSSSCSSLSAASLNWDSNLIRDRVNVGAGVKNHCAYSASEEEDDCTLNEMMGKYDESYVYEKETDILSDSDPTDCETDIDTGQDGGDEDDPLETELDFIDNGSFLDFNFKDERMNTGHCTYFNFELQRQSARRRASRRSQADPNRLEKKRRSANAKKRHKSEAKVLYAQEGTRSAGATPISARKTKHAVSKLALEDRLRKRSNSVSIPRDFVQYFDQRDKEAERKYKELIVEAEHILKNIKCNNSGLSPRRVPGPANKRVELLRSENTPKPDMFISNRLMNDVSKINLTRPPPKFSPHCSTKRNHITKFISNNSPIMPRREESRSPVLSKKDSLPNNSPRLVKRRQPKAHFSPRRSPKARTKFPKNGANGSLSSDSEDEKQHHRLSRTNGPNVCPQSEPLRRKIYSNHIKATAFNFNHKSAYAHEETAITYDENTRKSCESLRQQVLMNTITNLKRSLEDQSASLKQIYSSSQN